jgi:hypothetical protein
MQRQNCYIAYPSHWLETWTTCFRISIMQKKSARICSQADWWLLLHEEMAGWLTESNEQPDNEWCAVRQSSQRRRYYWILGTRIHWWPRQRGSSWTKHRFAVEEQEWVCVVCLTLFSRLRAYTYSSTWYVFLVSAPHATYCHHPWPSRRSEVVDTV